MSNTVDALADAGLMPVPKDIQLKTSTDTLYPVLNKDVGEERTDDAVAKLTPYPTLEELKTVIDEQKANGVTTVIKPPSIEPLKNFLEKRATTIAALKEIRIRMAKHINNCKISNTVGNSASIIGGILCFVFPPVGVPVLLAGSATSLGRIPCLPHFNHFIGILF